MASIIDSLAGQLLQGKSSTQWGYMLGTDEHTAQTAVATALPMIVGALARNASRPEGAAALTGALDRDHDGSVLDDLAGFLNQPNLSDGDGILSHALGARRGTIEQGISKSSGLDPQKISLLMAALAPIVMGALGKARRSDDLDAEGVRDLLSQEEKELERKAPEIGMLGSLLDKDGDGSIVDDVIGKVGRGLLGNLLRGQ